MNGVPNGNGSRQAGVIQGLSTLQKEHYFLIHFVTGARINNTNKHVFFSFSLLILTRVWKWSICLFGIVYIDVK